MVRRRLRREPVAYIVGRKGFRQLELAVDRRVLIPRPETELLVETGARAARRRHCSTSAPAPARSPWPSPTSCPAARSSPPTPRPARWTSRAPTPSASASPIASASRPGRFPPRERTSTSSSPTSPTSPRRDWASLQPEVTEWEPREALLAGPDGLDAYPRPASRVRQSFVPLCVQRTAALAVEVGEGQAGGRARADGRGGLRRDRDPPRPGRHRAGSAGGAMSEPAQPRSSSSRAAAPRPPARRCERCIAGGGVASFPADGLYGLACDPLDAGAIARIHRLKGRDDGKPSAVMYFSPLAMRELVAGLGPRTAAAVSALLPGPVTLVVANPGHRYPFACREDRERLGVRLLAGPLAGVMCPIFQTSANLSGEPAPARFDDVPDGDRRRRRPGDRRRRADRPALDRRRHRRDRGGRQLDGPPPRRALARRPQPAPSPRSASANQAV